MADINTIASKSKNVSAAVWKTLCVCRFQYIIPIFIIYYKDLGLDDA